MKNKISFNNNLLKIFFFVITVVYFSTNDYKSLTVEMVTAGSGFILLQNLLKWKIHGFTFLIAYL